jgi:hypothetical protein
MPRTGRPKTKEYETLTARIPKELVDRVRAYAGQRQRSIGELIRNGLAWRITDGDMLYDRNRHMSDMSDMPEKEGLIAAVKEQVKAEVKAEILAELNARQAPASASSQQANDVPPPQAVAAPAPARPQPAADDQEDPAEPTAFDQTKYGLGELCVHGHAYPGTAFSLRRKSDNTCLACHRARASAYRQRKRQAQPA